MMYEAPYRQLSLGEEWSLFGFTAYRRRRCSKLVTQRHIDDNQYDVRQEHGAGDDGAEAKPTVFDGLRQQIADRRRPAASGCGASQKARMGPIFLR